MSRVLNDIIDHFINLWIEARLQISDFGLAKWLPEKWAHLVVSPIEGTFGYSLVFSVYYDLEFEDLYNIMLLI